MKNQTELTANEKDNENDIRLNVDTLQQEQVINILKGYEPHLPMFGCNLTHKFDLHNSDQFQFEKVIELTNQTEPRQTDINSPQPQVDDEIVDMEQDPESFSKQLLKDINNLRTEYQQLKQLILPLEAFQELALSYRNEQTGKNFSQEEITKDVMLHSLCKYIFQSVQMTQMTTDLRHKFVTHEEYKSYVLKMSNNKEREDKDAETQRQIKQLIGRLSEFETQQYSLEKNMKQNQEDLRKTAQFEELLELRKEVEKLPTFTNLNVLENQFNYFLTIKKFEQIQSDLDQRIIEVKQIGEQTVKTTDLDLHTKKLNEKILNIELNTCKKREQHQANDDFRASINKLILKNKKRKNEASQFKANFSLFKFQIDQKAPLDQLISLRDYINVLPTEEALQQLKNMIFDAIEAQKISNQQFRKLFQENCEIVERFDEVMTQKASKISLDEMLVKIQVKYDQQMIQIDKKINEAQYERKEYLKSFNNFSKIISEKIYENVKKVIHNMPSPVTGADFNPNTMMKILSLKVDKTDFSKIAEEKADKVECQNLVDSIRTLNKQLQHSIVLLNEQLMLHITRGQDSVQQKNDRAILLLDQGKLLENWAMKFQVGSKAYDQVEDIADTASDNFELNAAKQNLKSAIQDKHDWNVVSNGWHSSRQSRPKLLVSGPRIQQVPVVEQSPRKSKSFLKSQIEAATTQGTQSQIQIQSKPQSVASLKLNQISDKDSLGRVKSGLNGVRRKILAATSTAQHNSYNQLLSLRSRVEPTNVYLNESLDILPLANIEIQSARCHSNTRN